MKSLSQKLWLFIAAFTLLLVGSSFIFSHIPPTTNIVVDDIHSMINGGGNDNPGNERVIAPRKLPEKTKVATVTATFTGRTVGESDSVAVVIRQILPAGTQGPIVLQGKKKIATTPPSDYQLPLTVTPLTLNVWYSVELTFKHKNGVKLTQKGQIMRVTLGRDNPN